MNSACEHGQIGRCTLLENKDRLVDALCLRTRTDWLVHSAWGQKQTGRCTLLASTVNWSVHSVFQHKQIGLCTLFVITDRLVGALCLWTRTMVRALNALNAWKDGRTDEWNWTLDLKWDAWNEMPCPENIGQHCLVITSSADFLSLVKIDFAIRRGKEKANSTKVSWPTN